MKITKIEKKRRLYVLETDQEEKVYVTEDTIVRFLLSKEKEISESEWREIRAFAQFSYGKNLGLYFLSFKQRTCKEVDDYLKKYEINSESRRAILRCLQDENWLDDRRYAEDYVRQSLLSGDKGPMVIRQKLRTKGIALSVIEEALSDFDSCVVAEKVAEKLKRQHQGKCSFRALQMKIIQGLVNKGFSYDIARSTLATLDLMADEEEESELLAKELDKCYRKYSRKYDGYELKQRLIQALVRKGYDFDSIDSALRDYL